MEENTPGFGRTVNGFAAALCRGARPTGRNTRRAPEPLPGVSQRRGFFLLPLQRLWLWAATRHAWIRCNYPGVSILSISPGPCLAVSQEELSSNNVNPAFCLSPKCKGTVTRKQHNCRNAALHAKQRASAANWIGTLRRTWGISGTTCAWAGHRNGSLSNV